MTVDALADAFRGHAGERDRRHLPELRDQQRIIRGHEPGVSACGGLVR